MNGFRKTRGGLAGVEFALLSPLLLILFCGTIDLSNALLTARWLAISAGSVAEIASTASAQSKTLNILTDVQAWQATTAAFALFPSWTNPTAKQSFSITVSAVSFTASPAGCTQNCSYTANVRWSVGNNLGVVRLRPCGILAMASNGDTPSYLTLPAGNFGPTALLVGDIAYTFQPVFFGFLIGDIPMMQSGYFSPRINNDTALVLAGGAGVTVKCTPTS